MRLFLSLALIFGAIEAMADDADAYRCTRTIKVPEVAQTTLFTVPLDSHFFQITGGGQPDMRLRNERGEAVGFVVTAARDKKARTVRKSWPAEKSAVTVDSTTGLRLELRLTEKDPLPTGIRIMTPLRDFKHQVRIESSIDGAMWTSAGIPTIIFDYSRYVDARNDRVPVTANGDRFFRISINDITAEQESALVELRRRLRGGEETERAETTSVVRVPFRIDRVEFYRDEVKVETGELKRINYPTDNFKVSENEKLRQTMITFDSKRNPVTEIKLQTDADNFSRLAVVETETIDQIGQKEWHKLATGKLTRFNVGTVQREDVTLSIPQSSAAHYRIVIENQDSPALTISGVELIGPQFDLLFLASESGEYKLHYGSGRTAAGQFDTAALETAIIEGQSPQELFLQSPVENPNVKPDSGLEWKPWNDPRILGTAVIVAAVALGWGLFRASQRITLPPAQERQNG